MSPAILCRALDGYSVVVLCNRRADVTPALSQSARRAPSLHAIGLGTRQSPGEKKRASRHVTLQSLTSVRVARRSSP